MSAAVGAQMGGGARNAATEFTNRFQSEANTRSARIGAAVGKTLGLAVVGAAGAATAGIGAVLFKGLDRYKSLDATAKRLGAMGKSADQVRSIMGDINAVVEGTPIALDAASKSATQFLSAGVKEGKELKNVLTAIADASGFSGDGFDSIAQGFIQVQNAGKLTAEDIQNQFRNLPVIPWLAKSMGTDPASVKKMVSEGQIGIQQLMQAVEQNAGGMAKRAGDSIDGALGNMQTAIARTGANLLAAIFGDPLSTTEGPGGMAEAINKVTEKINGLNAWVTAHQGEIKQFFTDAAETAKALAGALGQVVGFLKEHPGLIAAAVAAFAGFKVTAGLAAVASTISGIVNGLRAIPGLSAAAAGSAGGVSGAAIGAGLAGAGGVAAVGIGSQQAADQGYKPVLEGRFPHLANDSGNRTGTAAARNGNSIFGAAGAQRERRGASPSATIGGAGAGAAFSSPREFAHSVKMPYWQSKGLQVGDHAADSYGEHQNGALDIMVPDIATGQGVLQEILSDPNVYGAIFNGQTYGYGQSGARPYTGPNPHTDHVHVWYKPQGFDTGGWLESGATMVQNNTGKRELILNPEQIKWLQDQGIDPNAILQGKAQPPPGMPGAATGPSASGRTEGYIPAGAGFSGKTGGGVAGSLIGLGGEAIKGAIQAAADGAKMAASFGAAGAGGPGAGAGIQMGADIGKRLVDYGTEMAGIGIGAASEILLPFGAPRWLSDVDPTSFIPRSGVTGVGTTTAEQAVLDQQAQGVDPNTQQHGQAMGAAPGPVDALAGFANATPEVEPAAEIRGGDTINLYPKDVDESFRLLEQRQKLQSMQYAGRP
jgi:tape measure domain-containing protein